MTRPVIEETKQGVEIRLHAQPGASKTDFAGLHGDRLKVRVAAKPVDGAANAALIKFLAKAAGISKSEVEMVRGVTSREKDFLLKTKEVQAVARQLRQAAGLDEKDPLQRG